MIVNAYPVVVTKCLTCMLILFTRKRPSVRIGHLYMQPVLTLISLGEVLCCC